MSYMLLLTTATHNIEGHTPVASYYIALRRHALRSPIGYWSFTPQTRIRARRSRSNWLATYILPTIIAARDATPPSRHFGIRYIYVACAGRRRNISEPYRHDWSLHHYRTASCRLVLLDGIATSHYRHEAALLWFSHVPSILIFLLYNFIPCLDKIIRAGHASYKMT